MKSYNSKRGRGPRKANLSDLVYGVIGYDPRAKEHVVGWQRLAPRRRK